MRAACLVSDGPMYMDFHGKDCAWVCGCFESSRFQAKYPIREALRFLHLRTYHILRMSVAQDQIIIIARESTLGVFGRIAFLESKRELMRGGRW